MSHITLKGVSNTRKSLVSYVLVISYSSGLEKRGQRSWKMRMFKRGDEVEDGGEEEGLEEGVEEGVEEGGGVDYPGVEEEGGPSALKRAGEQRWKMRMFKKVKIFILIIS